MKITIASLSAFAVASTAFAQPIPLDGTLDNTDPAVIAILGADIPAGAITQPDLTDNVFIITEDITLAPNGNDGYILQGDTFAVDGAVVTILPGTIVRGQPSTGVLRPGSLLITRGSQIIADGELAAPIVFTTAAVFSTTPGDPNFSTMAGRDINPFSSFRWTGAADEVFVDTTPDTSPLPLESLSTAPASGGGVEFRPFAGMWGALGILGETEINAGDPGSDDGTTGEELFEGVGLPPVFTTPGGTPSSELVRFGGVNNNDDSGIIDFVSIRHSGLNIVEGDEIQGLSLGGVGRGTQISNIDIYLTADDGIEFFGGTVNVRNALVTWVQDDAMDFDFGYNGAVQFCTIIMSDNATNINNTFWGDHGIELDGDDASESTPNVNSTQLPITLPVFANWTIWGQTDADIAAAPGTSSLDEMILWRDRGGAFMFNSVFGFHEDQWFDIDPDVGVIGPAEFGSLNSDDRFASGLSGFFGNVLLPFPDGVFADAFANPGDDAFEAEAQFSAASSANQVLPASPFGTIDANGTSGTAGPDAVLLSIPAGAVAFTPVDPGLTSGSVAGAFLEAVGFAGSVPPINTSVYYTTGWTALNLTGLLADSLDDFLDTTND